ncbi:hypothetical protein AAU01_21290 [Paenarthrobacter aurescens]|uniref:Uncharacterized protein n=1 Tax=Paenarthrobacter aurescens TaxID=43663 RepID=A0A4Y3NBR2_PAEAU|nr:hypothetical protein AAU01_21290 [Paenarthrobacter aurescens]
MRVQVAVQSLMVFVMVVFVMGVQRVVGVVLYVLVDFRVRLRMPCHSQFVLDVTVV